MTQHALVAKPLSTLALVLPNSNEHAAMDAVDRQCNMVAAQCPCYTIFFLRLTLPASGSMVYVGIKGLSGTTPMSNLPSFDTFCLNTLITQLHDDAYWYPLG